MNQERRFNKLYHMWKRSRYAAFYGGSSYSTPLYIFTLELYTLLKERSITK